MLLEMDIDELLILMTSEQRLKFRIDAAFNALSPGGFANAAQSAKPSQSALD